MSSIDVPAGLTVRSCAAGSESLLALCRDFEQQHLPHAILLSGESGTGKKTLAHLLAQGMLCSGQGDKPCGQCRECRRYLNRTHPDALFPAPAPKEKTIKVETLRATIDALSRHAMEGGRRVIVIENAERMTPQAQNSLLKTLEEAQEGTYFFLTSDHETALLPTIRSRCRCVRVEPWPIQRIEKTLTERHILPQRAHLLARLCEGSLGRALEMDSDDGYWQARETVRRTFLSVRSVSDIVSALPLLKEQKEKGDELLNILEQELRALLHARMANTRDLADDFPPHLAAAPVQGVRRLLESVLTTRRQKAANVDWIALSEGLMQTILEETNTWQL